MAINYVICAAGEGSRFKSQLPSVAKPEIVIKTVPLLIQSLKSLPIQAPDRIVIITQTKHRLKEKMLEKVQGYYPFNAIFWLELDHLTKGQLATAALAKPHLDLQSGTVIFNSDTYFECPSLWSVLNDPQVEGLIPCVHEKQGDSWSFCRTNEKHEVLEVQEKKRISDWCSVGFYYFRDTAKWLGLAEQHIKAADSQAFGEVYVAPLYNVYIEQACKIKIIPVERFYPMGTPDQIEKYWKIEFSHVVRENQSRVLVMDLDNTITLGHAGKDYAKALPNLPVIEKMREFKKQGFKIVIHTARRMKTCQNDEARVVANVAAITHQWLKEHAVPCDGLKFGKPYAEGGFYVDDRAIRPSEFLQKSVEEIHQLLELENSTSVGSGHGGDCDEGQ